MKSGSDEYRCVKSETKQYDIKALFERCVNLTDPTAKQACEKYASEKANYIEARITECTQTGYDKFKQSPPFKLFL